jgi:hypothetical protein
MEAKRWTLGVVLAVAVSLFGLIQADASPFSSYVLSDDLGNVVNGTAPEQGDWENDSGSEDGSSADDSGSGADNGGDSSGNSSGSGSDANSAGESASGGTENDGHGNNEDGVDSSNKGNSKTGEDTVCADGTFCDDEIKTSNGGSKK